MTTMNRIRRGALLGVAAVALGGCDFVSPIEANPNSVPTATVDQLFTGIQVNTWWLSSGGLSRIGSIWTQQMRGTARQHAGFDAYTIGEPDFEDEMSALYTQGGLIDIRGAIAQAEATGRVHYAGILKVYEAFLVGLVSSYYGDIPFREAAMGVEEPVVDDMAQIYADLQALLDDAIADLSSGTGGASPGAVDQAFQGNTTNWIAVAHSLKARYYMHWGEVQGNPTYTLARNEALLGVRATAGNWKANFGTGATEESMWFQFQRDRGGDIQAGGALVQMLVANSDPRAPLYFTSPYTAGVSGLSLTGFGQNNFDFPIVTCAETLFIEAEAEARLGNTVPARTAANAAIDCDEAEYTPALDLSARQTIINGLTGAALLEEIMDQKYIAQFLNPDVFNDYKRSCFPAEIAERTGGMPGRLFYGESERKTNSNVAPPNVDPNDKYNDNDPTPCPVP